jgi:hypothetical protein
MFGEHEEAQDSLLDQLKAMFGAMLDVKLAPMFESVTEIKQQLTAVIDRVGGLERWQLDLDPRVSNVEKRLEGLGSSHSKMQEDSKQRDKELELKLKEHVRLEVTKITTAVSAIKKAQGKIETAAREQSEKMESELASLDEGLVSLKASSTAGGSGGSTEGIKAMQAQLDAMQAQMAELIPTWEQASNSTEVEGLRSQVAAMQAQLAELVKKHGAWGTASTAHGAQSGGPPSAVSTVEATLKMEAEAGSRTLKLVGLVPHRGGQEKERSSALLCQEAGEVLGRMVGGGVRIEVDRAWWMVKEGLTPMLGVTLRTHAMASAVRALRGGEGKRIMQWWGAVEKAVRDVLFKEREATLARDPQAQARVQGSRLWVGGVQRALSQEAVTAGMSVITRPRSNGPAQGARPPPHTAGRQQHTGVNQQRRNN